MMERLTKRTYASCADGFCDATGCANYNDCPALEKNNRLAYYEDTGLEPEQVKDMAENAETRLLTWFEAKYGFPVGKLMDLCEAEGQGRLVVLPCKVGDKVCDTFLGDAREKTVVSIALLVSESVNCVTVSAANERGAITQIENWRFGKTVFLAREEAEQALTEKAYEQAQDAVDQHNREAMRKIAEFIEQMEGGAN